MVLELQKTSQKQEFTWRADILIFGLQQLCKH